MVMLAGKDEGVVACEQRERDGGRALKSRKGNQRLNRQETERKTDVMETKVQWFA